MAFHHALGDSQMARDLIVCHAFSQLQEDHRSWHDTEASKRLAQSRLILFFVEPDFRRSGLEKHFELVGAMRLALARPHAPLRRNIAGHAIQISLRLGDQIDLIRPQQPQIHLLRKVLRIRSDADAALHETREIEIPTPHPLRNARPLSSIGHSRPRSVMTYSNVLPTMT